VALLEVRGEEGADAGFDEDVASGLAHQQRAATQVDAVLLVGLHPALPERLGGVAEHGAAIELLAVARKRGQGSHAELPLLAPPGLGGRRNKKARCQKRGAASRK